MGKDISLGSITFDETGQIVLAVQRKSRWFYQDGSCCAYYTGIGGNLEQGETPTQCLEREALEETSAQIAILQPITSTLFINVTKESVAARLDVPLLLAVYEMRSDDPEPHRSSTCLVPIYLTHCHRNTLHASGDVPALIVLSLERILAHQRGISIAQLYQHGSFISHNPSVKVPDDLVLLPFVEPRLLAEHSVFAKIVQRNLDYFGRFSCS